MLTREDETRRIALERRLAELDAEFADQMRKRGFDPAQADNLALPSALARMFAERLEIADQLEELTAREQTGE